MSYINKIPLGATKLKSKSILAISSVALSILGLLIASVMPLAANASASSIYNNIPTPLPGNLPSQAFEATSTSEFGGQVQFDGSARQNPTVTVVMSSWGCENGNWFNNTCSTTPGSTFQEPITLNIYNVNSDNSPGSLVKTVTQTFNIPFRPSADTTKCTGDSAGEWYSTADHKCFNGLATPITFNLTNTTLPNKAIITVAYNTSDYGHAPYGDATTCHATTQGCGYDSLNVALTAPPTVGTDPLPNDAYLNSSWSGAYCPGGSGIVGTLSLDTGCWTGYQPAIKVSANLSSKDDCKNNGWKNMTNPGPFKNQGDCVSYFATNGKNSPNGL